MPAIFHEKSRRSAVSPSSLTNRRATLPNPIRTSVSSGRCILWQRSQQLLQAIESRAVVFGRFTEAEAQVSIHAEVIAGYDQHALLFAQARDERCRIDRVIVTNVHDRAGFGFDPMEAA